jgi:hypothetical protein
MRCWRNDFVVLLLPDPQTENFIDATASRG